MAQPEPADRPLARYTRPHEADTSDTLLRLGERLPAGAVKRALDALVACTASLQDSSGRFIAVRPQPGLARATLTEFLERVLDAEVPGRSEQGAVALGPTPFDVQMHVIDPVSRQLESVFKSHPTPPDEMLY